VSPARDPDRARQLAAMAGALAAHPRSTAWELSRMVTAAPPAAPASDEAALIQVAPARPQPITVGAALILLGALRRAGRARCTRGDDDRDRWEAAGR
jgi:hypothetical protein